MHFITYSFQIVASFYVRSDTCLIHTLLTLMSNIWLPSTTVVTFAILFKQDVSSSLDEKTQSMLADIREKKVGGKLICNETHLSHFCNVQKKM